MKRILIGGGIFLGLLFVHLLVTILFLFVSTAAITKAMWLTVLLLFWGIDLWITEGMLSRSESEGNLNDSDLGQVYLMKKTVSSLLCAAGANTFVYVVNAIFELPKTVAGVMAILFSLVCIANVIALLLAQRSDYSDDDQEEYPDETQEELL